jgi:hypothetical protein
MFRWNLYTAEIFSASPGYGGVISPLTSHKSSQV